ncbi:prenyltransferase [Methanocella sp. CWC-04]|uniref:Prenyltransferase n=1 Tax=Methanooceanicella nereidis TaxID=2052831 RepID=A0AAP2R9U7_9EURY|nr:UbiA family prenyltransferase [Methanocella sp. CWC-04]MCD1293566.1 prenyltransferase [Methanocella sp. CWC-04]
MTENVNANTTMEKWIADVKYSRLFSEMQNELIYGGHLASMVSPAFVLSVAAILNTAVDLPILLISYLIPLIVYSYNYYGELEKDMLTNPERASFVEKKVKSYPVRIVAYILILGLLLLFFANYYLIGFIFALVFGGILFTVFLKDLTKKIVCFKNVYTALMWASSGAFLFLFYYSLDLNLAFVLIFIFIFLKVILNVIFFDLKDIEGDGERGLKTLPVLLGKNGTLKFLHGLSIFAFVPLFIGIYLGVIPLFALSLLSLCIYNYYYLKKAETIDNRNLRILSYTMADAEFLIWPILLLVGKTIFLSVA